MFLLAEIYSFAQNPAHFSIGEPEFANTHVYSIKQHPNGTLFAATNYGLYAYRNGSFHLIDWLGEHHGDALFSLTLNSKNELYCANLKGQIFRVTDEGLRLYVETPKEYLNSLFDFGFDVNDRIVIQSKVVAIFSSNWRVLYHPDASSTARINATESNDILVTNYGDSNVYHIKNGKINIIRR